MNNYTKQELKRRKDFPDTFCFTYNNPHPEHKLIGDCVIRAFAIAENRPWEDVFKELLTLAYANGDLPNSPEIIKQWLKNHHWIKQKSPRHNGNKKVRGYEFCKTLINDEPIIANMGSHHIVCIRNRAINDTWNSSCECVGNYWIKETNHYNF